MLLIAIYGSTLLFNNTTIIINLLYGLIILLCLLLHVVIIKKFNTKFYVNNSITTIVTKKKYNFLNLLIKIITTQGTIWLIATWLWVTILSQVNLSSNNTAIVATNYKLTEDLIVISNLINWLVIISLLISFGLYRYYFKYPDVRLRLARCLVKTTQQQSKLIFFYNRIANLESYARFIILSTCSTIITMLFFNSISHRFKFTSFLPYSSIVSTTIIIFSQYFKKHLDQAVDFLGSKTSISAFNIYLIMSLFSIVIIFVFNQFILLQTEFLKLIHFKSIALHITKNFIDTEKSIVLLIAINIVLMICASDLLLKLVQGYKLITVYVASLIGAVIQGFSCYFLIKKNVLYQLLNYDLFGLLMLLLILMILKFNFRNIFCYIDLSIKPPTTNNKPLKEGFLMVIKKIIYLNWLYLSSYYMFSWIVPMYIFGLGIIFLLPCILMLVIKILYKDFIKKEIIPIVI